MNNVSKKSVINIKTLSLTCHVHTRKTYTHLDFVGDITLVDVIVNTCKEGP